MSLDGKDNIEPLKNHMLMIKISKHEWCKDRHARQNRQCKLESRPLLSKKIISKSQLGLESGNNLRHGNSMYVTANYQWTVFHPFMFCLKFE